jgi:uncharacterized membrane protein YgaE (UPF0421/DUF939 family)
MHREDDAMRGYRRGRSRLQVCFISFGIGLVACFLFPTRLVIAVLAVALILCGLCDR